MEWKTVQFKNGLKFKVHQITEQEYTMITSSGIPILLNDDFSLMLDTMAESWRNEPVLTVFPTPACPIKIAFWDTALTKGDYILDFGIYNVLIGFSKNRLESYMQKAAYSIKWYREAYHGITYLLKEGWPKD